MTLAEARPATHPSGGSGSDPAPVRDERPPAVVLAVVVASGHDALADLLTTVAAQTRPPEHLLLLDTSADRAAHTVVNDHEPLLDVVDSVRVQHVGPVGSVRRVLRNELRAPDLLPADANLLWILTPDDLPEPAALARLVDAVHRSGSVGVAGPKRVLQDRPDRLESLGLHVTRTGRHVAMPVPGEPDQGQYDQVTDVLAVPLGGLLVERDTFVRLEGFDPGFGDVGSDVDFGWRAHLARRRVVVVPAARVRVPSGRLPAQLAGRQRRELLRVALSRCSLLVAPLLAAWVVVRGLLAGALLLVAKRPYAAARAVADLPSVLDPWRPLASRWRSRGTRTVARRDVASLFVPPITALRGHADLLRGEPPVGRRSGGATATGGASTPSGTLPHETGPTDDDASTLEHPPPTWLGSLTRSPGVLAVAATLAMVLVGGRESGLLGRVGTGLVGGELLGGRADASGLWHAWLDGWHGAGLGTDVAVRPYLPVLAALAWLGEQLPLGDPATSSAGVALAALVGLTLPVACATAYRSAHVLTAAGWPRALAALAWVSLGAAGVALGEGRVGALVALVLLPPVCAGLLTIARGATTVVTFATALGAAVLGAFAPALLLLVVVLCLGLLLAGRGTARLAALAVAVVAVALQGPWLREVVANPWLLLGGPGLTQWSGASTRVADVLLIHPEGPASYAALLGLPLAALGVVGLSRSGGHPRLQAVLAGMTLVSLVAALAAPRVTLGTVPLGHPGAGSAVTPWAGLALLPLALALLSAALVGFRGLGLRRSEAGRPVFATWGALVVAVAAVLAAVGTLAWFTVGDSLAPWQDPRPAVAVDQAEGELANRTLVVSSSASGLTYRVVGRETGALVRDVPLPATAAAPDLDAVLGALFGDEDATRDARTSAVLTRHGVGFVALTGSPSDAVLRRLDAVPDLSRSGSRAGVVVWRVRPAEGNSSLAPSRLRWVAPGSSGTVATTGDHAATSTRVEAPAGARLVVAEPAGWSAHATVTLDGQPLTRVTGQAATGPPSYVLPGPGELEVDLTPTDAPWRLGQGLLLLAVAYLAIPMGTGRRRKDA